MASDRFISGTSMVSFADEIVTITTTIVTKADIIYPEVTLNEYEAKNLRDWLNEHFNGDAT